MCWGEHLEHIIFDDKNKVNMKYPSLSKKGVYFFILFFFTFILMSSSFSDQNKEIEQLDFAGGLLNRGLYQMAISEYEEFLDAYSQSEFISEAHFGIAEGLFLKDDYDVAIVSYEKFLSLTGGPEKKALAHLRLAQTHYLKGEYQKAQASFDQVDHESF